jgi:streptomycin 6-kinase
MIAIPEILDSKVGATREGRAWLESLSRRVAELSRCWALRLGTPIEEEVSISWVAPCETPEGEQAILKLGYPHTEARDEIDGLEFWDGDPTVRLLRADRTHNAMLLERCVPGTSLRRVNEETQDEVIADLLRRLWRQPAPGHGFRPLAEMLESWSLEALGTAPHSPDPSLVVDGVRVFRELISSHAETVLLATDLHAGNVLRSRRGTWLAIDPKPFVGDPCYDGTQHLLNCRVRMSRAPGETVTRFAHLLGVDERRFRRWAYARFATYQGQDTEETARIASQLAD